MSGESRYSWLHEALAGQALVITSSRRLARELRAEFDQRQIAAGHAAWASAEVHFWQDWLQNYLAEQTGDTARKLLDTSSSVLLWERCLGPTAQAELLSTAGLVRQARRAWQRIQEWQVSLEQLEAAAMSRDEHWFARAASNYQQHLDEGGWLDPAQLAGYCAAEMASAATACSAHLVYAGFDRLTPAQAALFAALQKQGSEVRAAPAPRQDTQSQPRSFADAASMWRAAGRWARERLQEKPDARIAIIAPDLETDASGVARKVREGFAPGWQLAGGRYRDAVEVSYGMPLSAYPVISVAGLCLRFAADALTSTELSVLLRTPYLGDGDINERSRFDLYLRSLPDRRWQPSMLLDVLQQQGDEGTDSALHIRLQKLSALHAQRSQLRSPADWAQAIDELLGAIGWPGIEEPDSAEFQLQNRWRQLLNELARLGAVRGTLALQECVGRLYQIAGEAVYQPEMQGKGLRLLGMLEAAGLEFDYLWIGALDASRWPAGGHPLALVNRTLQRELDMPDATPADTLAFSQRTLQRIVNSTGSVELCWARLEDDKELMPSPLLDLSRGKVMVDSGDPSWYAETLLGAPLIPIPADAAPPVQADEHISGGAYTVQAMREEPFSAFAKGRLHINELDPLQPGLSARARGILVHSALHHLLQESLSQEELRNWSAAVRAERIDKAAWHPLARHWHQADEVLQRLLQLENKRLKALLNAFLDAECDRESFVIEGVERAAQLRFGPVTLRLRVDRLDRLGDGSLLITDYKASEKRSFFDKHKMPANIQLCVYARAFEDDAVGGLQLVFINSRGIFYVGEGGSLPRSKIDSEVWSGVLESWCAEVEVLLKRFVDGETGLNALQEIKKARPLAVLSRFAELPDAV